jgi:hypothetical protein
MILTLQGSSSQLPPSLRISTWDRQSDRCDVTNVALREVKTLGDGILAAFDGQRVKCTVHAITAGVRPLAHRNSRRLVQPMITTPARAPLADM